MKKFFFAFAMVLIGNLSAQTPIYDTNRLYDIVTDDDSCYFFFTPKPCIEPSTMSYQIGTVLLQEYVTTDTVTVYGVAITFTNEWTDHPFLDNCTGLRAVLMTPLGPTYGYYYGMQPIDTVTMNRSHPRFSWFRYKDDCGGHQPLNVPCYEFYFDTPHQVNRMTDTFYVGYCWQPGITYFFPYKYGGKYDDALPPHLYYGFGDLEDSTTWADGATTFAPLVGDNEKLWGVAFPITGFRCGPILGKCNLNIYTADTVVASWRNAEQGILYNVRLVGEDGSDTTYITTDTTYSIANFSDSVRYEVMLRKQCRYCTTNYDTTVYGEWQMLGSFGTTILPDTTSGGGNDTTGGGGNQGIAQLTDGAYFTLNPNPAHESVQVLLPAAALGGRLTFCDLSGRELIVRTATSTSIEVDVSALPIGTYLVKLTTPAGTTVKKLLLC